MPQYNWKPIESLSGLDRKIDLAAMRPIYETWKISKGRLQQSSPTTLKEFNNRLIRRVSIETGILEKLYDLDRGTTEALITKGFVEDLISHSSTDIEPSHLIDILRDQESAIQLVMDCIARKRSLSKGLMHELHAILTRHQEHVSALDQFGNRREIPLLKGRFKELPNNPLRPDGSIHQYCPPEQVDSEIENLLTWLEEYGAEDPIVVAAWMHHRFTQIHPYQDGNGRVARALTTLLLLRSDLMPLVIDRDLRLEYIESLEIADAHDLSKLASLFARLERAAMMQALSVDFDSDVSYQQSLTSAVIENIIVKFGRRKEKKNAEFRKVNSLALALRVRARKVMENVFNKLKEPVSDVAAPQIHIADGGPDNKNAYWYKFEVVQSAKENGKYANFEEDHYFVKAAMRVADERLVFVTSFHHVGRELTGIMEATAFARLESFENSDEREYVAQDFFLCSLDPFVFTYRTSELEIGDAFARWLDAALAVAIKEYGDRL